MLNPAREGKNNNQYIKTQLIMEYVWCMDTHNRERERDEYLLDNPTNDVKVRPQLSVNRLTVTAIELVTLELPRVQRLIEYEWSRVYTYNGLPLYKNLGNSVVVKDCCYTYEAKIPYVLNQITSIDQTDPTSPIFTTATPHLLGESLDFWDFGQDVELLGLPVTVTVENPILFPGEPNKFQLTGFPITTNWTPNAASSNLGTLYYPPLPSPEYISEILTSGLNASFVEQTNITPVCSVFEMIFDPTRSRFCVRLTGAAVRTPDIDFVQDAVILVPSVTSLASLLGFTKCNHPLCGKGDEDFYAFAANPPYGTSFVALSPGTYLSGQLATEIEQQCNSTYFEPLCVDLTKSTDIPANAYHLTICTDTGSKITIDVPPGMYTPVTLAETISELLLTTWPAGQVELSWDKEDGVYTFTSMTGKVFSLEFQNLSESNIASKLGFHNFRYGSEMSYDSDEVVNAQDLITACPIPGLDTRYNLVVCEVEDNVNATKFTFYSRAPGPLPITGTTVQVEGANNELVRVTNPQQAHGFQVGDVAQLTVDGQIYHLEVVEVPSGTEFIASLGTIVLPDNTIPTVGKTLTDLGDQRLIQIDAGSAEHSFVAGDTILLTCRGVTYVGTVTPPVTATDTNVDISPNQLPIDCFGPVLPAHGIAVQGPILIQHSRTPTISIFTSGNNTCSIKPLILGFGSRDVMWNGTDVAESPFVYRLQASTYILLEMVYPCLGNARIEHRYNGDNRTTILGKIITLSDPFLDRFYPMKATFYTAVRLEYCHFRLLNPDHTLYKLHGHDWQATFRLYTPEKLIEC